MRKLFNKLFGKKEVKEVKTNNPNQPLDVIFNVYNFNEWFVKPKEDSYASRGIFLRTDKLSSSFFFEYFESYEGINNGESFAYGELHSRYYEFEKEVREDWFEKLSNI